MENIRFTTRTSFLSKNNWFQDFDEKEKYLVYSSDYEISDMPRPPPYPWKKVILRKDNSYFYFISVISSAPTHIWPLPLPLGGHTTFQFKKKSNENWRTRTRTRRMCSLRWSEKKLNSMDDFFLNKLLLIVFCCWFIWHESFLRVPEFLRKK